MNFRIPENRTYLDSCNAGSFDRHPMPAKQVDRRQADPSLFYCLPAAGQTNSTIFTKECLAGHFTFLLYFQIRDEALFIFSSSIQSFDHPASTRERKNNQPAANLHFNQPFIG